MGREGGGARPPSPGGGGVPEVTKGWTRKIYDSGTVRYEEMSSRLRNKPSITVSVIPQGPGAGVSWGGVYYRKGKIIASWTGTRANCLLMADDYLHGRRE